MKLKLVRHYLDCQITFRHRNLLYHSYNDQSPKEFSDTKHSRGQQCQFPNSNSGRQQNAEHQAESHFGIS
jgi:hypothetical protein